ncbi:hypothetical protein DOTSEDRAFT_41548 [Dothistroma septosporum NZE10]|uniref:Tyrosinase copper-binding domain-containing protein n=1 Tax=Dothistroma septosporum (strain NZE10 / CBS 128990) TaxID=675120 RepID=N1PVR2_DOTSN|nr:hypothetical protein DOTSEDRAFT_41548 [Dothistroma septosporum NZE10]
MNLLLLVIFTILNVAAWSHSGLAIWRTDFEDARKAVQYEERKFTGQLTYDEAERRGMRLRDTEVEYVGPPSTKIEQAWKELLRDELPTMTKAEAAPFGDGLRPLPDDGEYHFEPDMFHSLHCLNTIRMELIPVLYNTTTPRYTYRKNRIAELIKDSHWGVTHVEHCLDKLRQAIMCHGDLTPSPMYSWPDFPLQFGVSGTHTCRKFEPIRKWMDQRGANGKSLLSE